MNISQTYHSDHFVIYTNIKSLYSTPETNIMLYVNLYLNKKFRNEKKNVIWYNHLEKLTITIKFENVYT